MAQMNIRRTGIGALKLLSGKHIRFRDHGVLQEEAKEDLIAKINREGWKFNKKTQINYQQQEIPTLHLLLTIMQIANSAKSGVKPHCVFKKNVKMTTSLGIAGPGNDYWKEQGICGITAHRLYDQLFKFWKKNP